jgi:toxin ParE1/3/4
LPAYSVARSAEADLKSIIDYTMKTWGSAQARRYSQGLRNTFQLLADNPSSGRTCDSIHRGLRWLEHGKHVVFYVCLVDGVLIVRVLHQQMVPTKMRFED